MPPSKKGLRPRVLPLSISYGLLVFLYELSGVEEILCRVPLIMFRPVSQPPNEVLRREATAFSYGTLIQQAFNFPLRLTVHLYRFRVVRPRSMERV